MRKLLLAFFLVLININAIAIGAENGLIAQRVGPVLILTLSGSYEKMGEDYGAYLKQELKEELAILKNFYTTQHGVSYEKMKEQADLFYARFPYSYQLFIQAMAKGAKISLDDAKILNAMETLGRLVPKNMSGHCAFLFLPGNKTITHKPLIGRNYDFGKPYDLLSKYLTVTILKNDNTIPTAFIAIAGQIYCPTCINAKGIFLELNNGSPSGGRYTDINRQSLLINMLHYLRNAKDLAQVDKQLNATQSDYSLIVNAAQADQVNSYEFSSTLGMHKVSSNDDYASTNFYLSKEWKNIPEPTDETTWYGVTRRNNLINLSKQQIYNVKNFQELMDKRIQEGGAVWQYTIYQLIFDSSDYSLYIKINRQGDVWHRIPLKQLLS